MRYLPLVWAGLWRKRTQTVLVFVQIVIAFTLFGILQGLNAGIRYAISRSHADRLYVLSRQGASEPLPIALLTRIKQVPGIDAVSYRVMISGTYQNRAQHVQCIAADPEGFAKMFPEIAIAPAQLTALVHQRDGAVVGEAVARELRWKIGDRVPLQLFAPRQNGSRDWTFEIVGTFSIPERPSDANYIVLNYDYVNEERLQNHDSVNLFTAHIRDPAESAEVGHEIDLAFANSPNETRTQSETDLAASQIKRIADVDFLAHRITAAAFVALLLATATLMMQSVRERTSELAVLKTLGFSDAGIMGLIFCEVVLVSLAGSALGLLIAWFALPYAQQFIGISGVPGSVFAIGFVYATLMALVSGLLPALRGLRLQIAEALSGQWR